MKEKSVNISTFIEKAKKIHGDKYDYSLVEYLNSSSKVKIICPTHGEFEQTPNSHLSGSGCPRCTGLKLKTNDEVIIGFKKIHGDKYDYSLVEYKNSATKVKIICPIHGVFEQRPNTHLKGVGCSKCSKKHKHNNEEFIEEAKKIHGDKYDYSLVEYIRARNKIKIICREHGMFEQTPNCHLSGSGCSKCGINNKKQQLSSNKENFIIEAKKIHGDKYNYDKVEYINAQTKVKIICPEHGEFMQVPTSHIYVKCGCSKCAIKMRKLKISKSKEVFIEQAKKIHGDKYNYDKVEYVNTDIKVVIECPKHGIFLQKPTKHLQMHGCPSCRESKLENKVRKWLDEKNIKYIYQFNKSNAKWIGLQSLDFYLPDFNASIECQGEQHFKPVDFGNKGNSFADEEFKKIHERDRVKFNKCKENGVKIFYFTENISSITDGYFDIIYTKLSDILINLKNISNG